MSGTVNVVMSLAVTSTGAGSAFAAGMVLGDMATVLSAAHLAPFHYDTATMPLMMHG